MKKNGFPAHVNPDFMRNTPGRPNSAPDKLKKKVSLMLSPAVIAYLEATSFATGISKSALAENCIRLQMRKDGGDPNQAAQTSGN
jgi:hypothetical protein